VVRNALKRASKAADLPAPRPTLHDLRHTHASMLIALDYSIVEVQHRLGHKDPATTLRIYAHLWKYRDAQRSDIGNRINTLLTHPEQANGKRALPPPTPQHAAKRQRKQRGRYLTTSATV